MCGRQTNEKTWAEIYEHYSAFTGSTPRNTPARYNIAPTTDIDFCRLDQDGNRVIDHGRWALVPFFAKEMPKYATFNARIETVAESGAFREAFKSKRALIPADGYFEWTTSDDDGKKDPWHFHMPEHALFSFAGMWSHNTNLDITSCTIITAPAIPELEDIHERMPIILDPAAYDAYLDPNTSVKDALAILVDNQIDYKLERYRVGRAVNKPRYEGTDTKMPIVNSL